jgi:ABC-type sulfate transport system substrate-binding protein
VGIGNLAIFLQQAKTGIDTPNPRQQGKGRWPLCAWFHFQQTTGGNDGHL